MIDLGELPVSYGPSIRQTLVEAVRGARLTSQRALLTILGLTVGSASITALLHLTQGAEAGTLKMFESMGARLLMMSFPIPPGSGLPPSTLDTKQLLQELPTLTKVAPVSIYATQISFSGRVMDASIVSSTGALASVFGLRVASGRFIGAQDFREPSVVLGPQLAETLGLGPDALQRDASVRIENYRYRVIGILQRSPANPMFPIAFDSAAIIDQGAMRRLQPIPQLTGIIFEKGGGYDSETLEASLKLYFGRVWPGVTVEVSNARQLIEGMVAQSRTFALLIAAIGGIALIVSGIGVMNVMLMSVNERRREIGIRLSVGARSRDIRNMFVLEALGLSTAGAVTGTAVGLAASYTYGTYAGWPFYIDLEAIALGLFSPLFVGLVFGLYPAWAAARLQPLEVLRDE